MKIFLTTAMTILLFSCSSSESPLPVETKVTELRVPLEEEVKEKEEVKNPKDEAEEKRAEFARQAEEWKKKEKELQEARLQHEKLGYEVTKPIILIDKKAFAEIAKRAKAGDMDSQYKLGMLYKYGIGVKEDKNEALTWFKKAGDQGHMKAKRIYFFMLRSK